MRVVPTEFFLDEKGHPKYGIKHNGFGGGICIVQKNGNDIISPFHSLLNEGGGNK